MVERKLDLELVNLIAILLRSSWVIWAPICRYYINNMIVTGLMMTWQRPRGDEKITCWAVHTLALYQILMHACIARSTRQRVVRILRRVVIGVRRAPAFM
jgi:hypothetical protein